MMDIATISNIVMWLVGGLAGCFVFALSFAFAVKEKISVITEKQRNCEFVIEHLTKAGDNIKAQIASHDIVLEKMQSDIGYMKSGIEDIKRILTK